jgi:hypothetical protein
MDVSSTAGEHAQFAFRVKPSVIGRLQSVRAMKRKVSCLIGAQEFPISNVHITNIQSSVF